MTDQELSNKLYNDYYAMPDDARIDLSHRIVAAQNAPDLTPEGKKHLDRMEQAMIHVRNAKRFERA